MQIRPTELSCAKSSLIQQKSKMSILAEILREMYVDSEILEQLSMEQRDVLFRKMREEQVRRWRVKERELEAEEKRHPPKRAKSKVRTTDCSWVWANIQGGKKK